MRLGFKSRPGRIICECNIFSKGIAALKSNQNINFLKKIILNTINAFLDSDFMKLILVCFFILVSCSTIFARTIEKKLVMNSNLAISLTLTLIYAGILVIAFIHFRNNKEPKTKKINYKN